MRRDRASRSPEEVVDRVVARLDGLPLAIELAAAKVRGMSVQDIDRRLDDRFALLRGGDQSKPDRHQTLLAVIDWSWNLLSPEERDALQRLSVFHDGFTLDAADVVLGRDAVAEVESLVDQSLLTLGEGDAGVRYRMLETVREFGRMQLVGVGAGPRRRDGPAAMGRRPVAQPQPGPLEPAPGRDGRRDPGRGEQPRRLPAPRAPDAGPLGRRRLVAALGALLDDHRREPARHHARRRRRRRVQGWEPAARRRGHGRECRGDDRDEHRHRRLRGDPLLSCPAGHVRRPGDRRRAHGIVAVLGAQRFDDLAGTLERLRELGDGPDRYAAMQALMWLAHYLENNGDPEQSIDYGTRALARCTPEDGPSFPALLRTIIGGLHAQLGQHAEAAPYLVAALRTSSDSARTTTRSRPGRMLAAAAMVEGRLDDAAAQLAVIERQAPISGGLGGPFLQVLSAAELSLARGDIADGLSRYTAGITGAARAQLPGHGRHLGLRAVDAVRRECGAAAFALHGESPAGDDLFQVVRAKAAGVIDPERPHLDFPVAGSVLYALGAWGLFRRTLPLEDAARLLVLADRFACTRYSPTMTPSRTHDVVERRAPGLMARIAAELGERRGPDLLVEARAAIALALARAALHLAAVGPHRRAARRPPR